jgi:hypothetical protein
MYVLVISRQANVTRLYVDNLVIRGYLAIGANNLAKAERLIKHHPPGLVLLCQVPNVDEADYTEITSHPALSNVPVLLLSVDRVAPPWLNGPRTAYDVHPLPISRLTETVEELAVVGS